MLDLLIWIRQRSIFIILGVGIVYIILRHFIKPKNNKFNKNVKLINKNKKQIFDDQHENRILEYSREDSLRFGFKNDSIAINRPIELIKKGMDQVGNFASEQSKISNNRYSDALKRVIPLSYLYDKETLSNKTIRVYVEDVVGTLGTLRDSSAIYELNFKGVYGLAGEFVLINIDKKGDEIKINYILKDY